MSALNYQVGGNHYKQLKIEPIEYIVKNNLGYREGNAIKYISRHQFKNGAEDVRKAIHMLEMILEDYESGELPDPKKPLPEIETLTRVDDKRKITFYGN